jgi:hypothetical protein
MASLRFYAQPCPTNDLSCVDVGTMITAMSDLPGVIGASLMEPVSDLARNFNRKIDWLVDMGQLDLDLMLELKRFVDEVPLIIVLPRTPEERLMHALAASWDKHINRIGASRNKFSRNHKTGCSPLFDWLAKKMAATDPLKLELLEHYITAQGKKVYYVGAERMRSSPTFFDLFDDDIYSPNLQGAIYDALAGLKVPVDTVVKGQNDGLGNFALAVQGFIQLAPLPVSGERSTVYYDDKHYKETPDPLLFEGAMSWSDDWNFDAKVAYRFIDDKNRSGRGVLSEVSVEAVATLVDGVPFKVTSAVIPLKQFSGFRPVF